MTSSSPARWRRRKAARPDEIHAAALDCFAEHGFAATRLEDVARRAGVSKATLYLYVASKEELFKNVVRETLLPKLALLESKVEPSASATSTLRSLLQIWVDLIQNSPLGALPKVVLAESGNFPDLARFYLDEVVDRAQRLVGGIIARGGAAGEFRESEPRYAAMSLLAPLVFLMLWKQSLGKFENPPLDIPAFGAAQLDLLLFGLLAPDASERARSEDARRRPAPKRARGAERNASRGAGHSIES